MAEATHGLNQGMDRTAESKVPAQADGQMVQTAETGPDGGDVSQGLGGMHMAPIPSVDDRDAGCFGGHQGGPFLRVPHGD